MAELQNRRLEDALFLVWLRKEREYGRTAKFYMSKLHGRIQSKLFGRCATYYPREILSLLPSLPATFSLSWRLAATRVAEPGLTLGKEPDIVLASKTVRAVDDEICWDEHFDDAEDEESIHRWNWILHLLSDGRYPEDALVSWVTHQLEKWFSLFLPETQSRKRPALRWESYTVGERISNTILFYYLTHACPSDEVLNGIRSLVGFLTPRMEYQGTRTGNHVFNNARAVYLAGAALGVDAWSTLGTAVIERELPLLVTQDGFLREGSSHYQFLFTRWLLEINHFAGIIGDSDLVDGIRPYAESLLKQCQFFLVHNSKENRWNMPKFGDISPDFAPSWFIDLPWSKLSRPFRDGALPFPRPDSKSTWAGLFFSSDKESTCPGRVTVSNDTKSFPESGWFRFDWGNMILFLRLVSTGVPDHVGHYHDDMFHFCLFHKGIPVLVDSGRCNYRKEDVWSVFGCRPEAHNALLVDGTGPTPFFWQRYPSAYAQCRNSIVVDSDDDMVKIALCSTGFQRLVSPVKIVRTLVLSKGEFAIEDEFCGNDRHLVQTFFHWAPGLKMCKLSNSEWSFDLGDSQAKFRVETDGGYQVKTFFGGENPLGWVVDRYGKATESTTLEVSSATMLPFRSRYSICWQ